MKGCQVEVPMTMTMANTVKTGNFRANSQMVAQPFSVINLPSIKAANMANYYEIELDVLMTKGYSIPKDIARKLTENKAYVTNWHGANLLWQTYTYYQGS
jgi:hypothetical protein